MSLWLYRAKCARVVDGDTIDVEMIDQGFGDQKVAIPESPLRFRLAGINAYETRLVKGTTPEEKAKGLEAKQWLADRIEGKRIRVRTVRSGAKGSFGRWLAYIFDDTEDGWASVAPANSLNRQLLDEGFAVVSAYPDGEVFVALGYPR